MTGAGKPVVLRALGVAPIPGHPPVARPPLAGGRPARVQHPHPSAIAS
jgi:hypothetical protein